MQLYGWRAYALPVLSVITVAALVHNFGATARSTVHTVAGRRGVVTARSSQRSVSDVPTARPSGRSSRVQVEGLTGGDAGFDAGSTPSAAPVVINLGDDGSSCATNTYGRLVLVSISKQRLWVCEDSKQIAETPVTTGATIDHDQTPVGSWRVQAKQRNRYLVGPGYKDYVHYWVPFDGDFGLHDATWQTMPFGSKDWPTQGSHGCVHVPTKMMAWLYQWATVRSTVVTVET